MKSPKKNEAPDFEWVVKHAKKITLEAGSHSPMLMVNGTHKGTLVGFEEYPKNHSDKLRIMLNAGVKVGELKESFGELKSLYFISEAWVSVFGENEKPDKTYTLPSQDPKRKEALVIMGRNVKTKKEEFESFEMIRNKKGTLIDLRSFHEKVGQPDKTDNPLMDAFEFGYNKAEPVERKVIATA